MVGTYLAFGGGGGGGEGPIIWFRGGACPVK